MNTVLVRTAAVWFMNASIWTMQVLNHPLLPRVGSEAFVGYETAHNRRFLAVIGPGVGVAAPGSILLLVAKPTELSWWSPAAAAVLLVSIIALTVKYHRLWRTPVSPQGSTPRPTPPSGSNWVRTAA